MTAKDYQNGIIDGANRRDAENRNETDFFADLFAGRSHHHPERASDRDDYEDGWKHGYRGVPPANR
jgi:hypothetical protein